MELNKLIPNNNPNWVIKKKVLTYLRLNHIPLLKKEGDFYYIFLDLRLKKEVIRLVNHLTRLEVKFYFVVPAYSSPKGVLDFENENIKHYLRCYVDEEFRHLLEKYNYDLIGNLVEWCIEFNVYHLIKENYEDFKERVNAKIADFWSNTFIMKYPVEIRDDYNTLYRQIQINNLLN
jgi:hypothetical protein